MFFKKKKAKEEKKVEEPPLTIKAMYVLAFTQPKMSAANLKAIVDTAQNLLIKKQDDFKRIMETQMLPKTGINIANIEYIPLMHSHQSMASSLKGWLNNQYSENFYPFQNVNFFAQSLVDSHKKEHMVLFYFVVNTPDKK